MKIIVSTKNFQHQVKLAIANRTNYFEILGEKSQITFAGDKTICGSITGKGRCEGIFDMIQWYKMGEFLKKLSEQPITIEFSDSQGKTEITLQQFLITF